MTIKIRYIFGALALGFVAWLYYSPIEVGAPNVSYSFPCEPLGRTPNSGKYYFRKYPAEVRPGFFDSYIDTAYGTSSLNADDLREIRADKLRTWANWCQIARDNRKVQLEIALVASAVVFFAIPQNKAIKRKKDASHDSPDGEAPRSA